jgi:lipoprotein-anchoring transpeptidase ErfK/SrfK
MRNSSLLKKLPALALTVAAGQLTFASGASAQGGLLGTGLFAPPAAPATTAAQAPAAVTPAQVEQKLEALRYDVGPVDGTIDAATGHAVMAFQKVNGLTRTGELTEEVKAKIMATQGTPAPILANGEPNRVEVDLARQVLFLYENGSLLKILSVSSGTSETPTPTGTFRMYRAESGWHTSALGRLYNAQYFVGGYAIHGSNSVPAEPASHGCVRIPMNSAEWFPERVTPGMQVFIQ